MRLQQSLVGLVALAVLFLGMVYYYMDGFSTSSPRDQNNKFTLERARVAIILKEESKALEFLDAQPEQETFLPSLSAAVEPVEEDFENAFPDATKQMSFGERHGHRKSHILARESLVSTQNNNHPVLDLDSINYVPFRTEFVRDEFKTLPRVIVEAEYFRFEDELGLISTGWDDDQVLAALQSLVDIYAQGNIQIRLRISESLARVKLSRIRSLAYWFYVDYPKNAVAELSPQRLERKQLMDRVLGSDLVSLLQKLDGERQGLFDFIMGWPEERTVWENLNVVGMYPSFFYFFMNGGGNLGCMRFRTGDCNTMREIKLENQATGKPLYAKCYRFGKKSGDSPAVRSWERYNFTAQMAVRLVAHEFGHSVRLHHPKAENGCEKVKEWQMTNLMHQVRAMAPQGHTCRVTGWPELAAKATYLTSEQIMQARANIRYDLRQSPRVSGTRQVGLTTEVLAESCAGAAQSFVAWPNSRVAGKVKRIRWKSASQFNAQDQIRVSIGKFSSQNKKWVERTFQICALHALGAHVHQEQDVDLDLQVGEAIVITTGSSSVDLHPQSHVYANPQTLVSDVIASVPEKFREHPAINNLINSRDQNSLYPQQAAKAPAVIEQLIEIQNEWKSIDTCGRWVFNFDLTE